MKTSTGTPTKAEAARMAAFQKIGCLACRSLGFYRTPEVHHLLSGNKRRGHKFTVPLCSWHHRSTPFELYDQKSSTLAFGPSLALGSKPFHAHFGSDEELLAETNRLLEQMSS
jgi:hypothetical protein